MTEPSENEARAARARFREAARAPTATPGNEPGAVIGTGCEAEIVVASDPAWVVKRFFDPIANRGRVDREARALRLLSSRTPGLCSGARFPRLGAHRQDAGEIEMERARGETLAASLVRDKVPDRAPQAIANGLVHYSEVVGEAYHDFAPVNVMWDRERQEAWFIDLASEHVVQEPTDKDLRLSVSLGYYLGAVAYEASRPTAALRVGGTRRQIRLIRAVCHELIALGIPVSGPHVEQTAWAQFRDASASGSAARKFWYRTGGHILAARWIRAGVRGIG